MQLQISFVATFVLGFMGVLVKQHAFGVAFSSTDRVDELLARMTIEEKIGQTVLLTGYGATTGR